MTKIRLYTPGPTPVPPQVLRRIAEPVIYHRSPEFRKIFSRVNENLRYIFRTARPVLTLSCSGTGGMEATFVNLFSQGDKIISVNGGKFGERWVKMPRSFGLDVTEIRVDWGRAPSVEHILKTLKEHRDVRAVYLVHCETSTGTYSDVRELAKAVRDHSDALVCIDGVSAIGALEFCFDDWGIDVCVASSQKGLMLPPGLAFVALSRRAENAVRSSALPKYYFDFRKALRSFETDDTPWTPPVSLIAGADTAFGMIRKEGIENVWDRHSRLASGIRSGLAATGLKLFSCAPSDSVTAVWLPEGIRWETFNRILSSDYGIAVGPGQEQYFGKIFRVAHLGYFDISAAEEGLNKIECAVIDCGLKSEKGSAVFAFRNVINNL